jgi:hypothetical protein
MGERFTPDRHACAPRAIYVDHQPPGYAFAAGLQRLTEAQVLAPFAAP